MSNFLDINPSQAIKFNFVSNKNLVTHLTLTSKSTKYIAYKIKTTVPKNYSAKPYQGLIKPFEHATIDITMQARASITNASIENDKFLVQAVEVDGSGMSLTQIWAQKNIPMQQTRLRVQIQNHNVSTNSLRLPKISEEPLESLSASRVTVDHGSPSEETNKEFYKTVVSRHDDDVRKSVSTNETPNVVVDTSSNNYKEKCECMNQKIEEQEKLLELINEQKSKFRRESLTGLNMKGASSSVSMISKILFALIGIGLGWYLTSH